MNGRAAYTVGLMVFLAGAAFLRFHNLYLEQAGRLMVIGGTAFMAINWLIGTVVKTLPPDLVYRKIVNRRPGYDSKSEVVELECGHVFMLRRAERSDMPCPECGEENKHAG